ncbi:hypothetical protein JYU34_003548 [Plutella xylostella]|uniref:Gamma-interferon inducible lysosomal thiol reductase n=1 Tax=Plutella xylostella TaxID=51655 RepID=A0ABQ7R0B4_PLUXY|nr:hypothetical protein JYU34_003548 [Plutella xylostella]
MVSMKLKIFVIIFLYSFQLCGSQGRKYGLRRSRNLQELLKTHSSPQENFTNNISVASSSVVEIKVYYETLCPGSIQFFRNQLKPIAERLAEHVKIHLIPFGFAEIKWHKSRPQFRCQHGALECFGNKLHACAAEALRGIAQAQTVTGEALHDDAQAKVVRGDAQAVLYAACLMDATGYRPSWQDQARAFQQCNTHMQLSQAQRSRIFACAAGRHGSSLLLSHAGDTRRLGPPYLPYVLVDGAPSEPYLLASICSKLQPKPDACWQHL